MQEEKSANTDLVDRETAVTKLSITKVEGMNIGNHKTAYNALHDLPEPHRTNLRRMGYGILFIYYDLKPKSVQNHQNTA